ncbi:50S ribosomal protein L24 [Ahniella affigens]|uniref:Large ribosomal subunit protein uL24 n=1 Tax=Ahniella affigens TaxID=2021234 RepID=A0A2P1PUV6_9GAMM|nr:50S ribosomal protein L24 [Ahniella affigens]AVP98614.1 50S ribosomal protein L24 [Ahniella affigens]
MKRIRKGDQVVVIAGSAKGQKGEVIRVDGENVFVQGIKLVKRHTKPNPQANQPGGIIEREAPIHQSNVQMLNSATGKGERISIKTKTNSEGKQVRVRAFRKSGEMIDV